MKPKKFETRVFHTSLSIIIVVSFISGLFVLDGKASHTSAYYYRFTVYGEGFTNVEINFNSTDAQGASWVFVPKPRSSWNYTVTKGQIVQSEVVETDQVPGGGGRQYFYQAFKFSYQANGFFNMTLRFGFDNGALIIEPRGVFYSPLIGFQSGSVGSAEVDFYSSFTIKSDLAKVIGASGNYYPATQVLSDRVLFSLPENIVRIQVEFNAGSSTPQYTTLKSSDNKTFAFKSVTRYQNYAKNVLRFYDRIYKDFTGLFNVTLDNVVIQWFLPDFNALLVVGGFVPVTAGERLGEIYINVVFIRAVNGTIEVIAAHELVHRFLGKAGLSPNDFLWFHEGMAQYASVSFVEKLGYADAIQERTNLDQSATRLIDDTGGNIGFIQRWSPSTEPQDIGKYYVASYYVINRLAEMHGGLDFYQRFFQLIHGAKVDDNNVLTLYLSMAANASVALTLNGWGFNVADFYTDSQVREMIKEAGQAIEKVNPVFQPYRSFAQYFYQQALHSAELGELERAKGELQIAITLANLSPLLTFLTILAILAILVYVLYKRSLKPKPSVPVPPPEILQPTA